MYRVVLLNLHHVPDGDIVWVLSMYCCNCGTQMTLDIPPEVKLEGESENVLSSSYDTSQNGRRKTRGQFTVREASLRTRSPKDRRVKMSPGQQIRAHKEQGSAVTHDL
ncbi:hypothetical protein JZ751_014599 [Albula glossodonta]|uniref:Uncharacterized protein n=1 Tax=Albula glossodonta TaxID=121402 RepID=A0A8T2N243_9TELE|nr:hypothetical protein JZ751_014599 [Albula glossodonta]